MDPEAGFVLPAGSALDASPHLVYADGDGKAGLKTQYLQSKQPQILEILTYTNTLMNSIPMPIETLPTEILLQITNYLLPPNIPSLRLTNLRFSILLSREIFYSALRARPPTPCHQAIFEAAFRGDKALIGELIRRGILKITSRNYRPLIEQTICEFHSAETIQTLLDCFEEKGDIEEAVAFAWRLGRESVVEVLIRYLG